MKKYFFAIFEILHSFIYCRKFGLSNLITKKKPKERERESKSKYKTKIVMLL